MSLGMAGQIDADADGEPVRLRAASSNIPASLLPSASTSLGHLTAIAASGAKCAAISATASAAAKDKLPGYGLRRIGA